MTYLTVDADTDVVVFKTERRERLDSAFHHGDAHFDETGSDYRVVDSFGHPIPRSRLNRAVW